MPLTSLDLSGYCSQIIGTGFVYLKSLPLTTLKLAECERIDNASLAHFKDLLLLTTLDLYGCVNITDDGVKYLKNLLLLTTLDLTGCVNITDDGFKYLKNLRVTNLTLVGCNITDAGVAYLKDLPLTALDLEWCHEITETGVAQITLMSSDDVIWGV